MTRRPLVPIVLVLLAACGAAEARAAAPATSTAASTTTPRASTTDRTSPSTSTSTSTSTTTSTTTTTSTSVPRTTPPSTTTTAPTASTSSTTTTSTVPALTIPARTAPIPPTAPPPPTPPPVPVPAAPVPVPDEGSWALPTLTPTVQFVTPGNLAISVSVWHDGQKVYGASAGIGAGGQPVTSDTPFVVASVSKIVTALTIARLAQAELLDLDAPVPWDAMGVAHDPWWNSTTARELMWHSAGMPVVQNSWLNQPGPCAVPLSEAMALPPRAWRGRWVYSNGNYCALGMLIEHITGQLLDAAARTWVFDRADVTGPHLTVEGLLPSDAVYQLDVRRLDRLGGAGTWMMSTDDVGAMLSSVTAADEAVLTLPGIMRDQYGWGHTGSVDGTRACAWVLNGGRTVLSAVVAGNRPSSGGALCDVLVPALAQDLGQFAGPPVRLPD